MIDYFESSVRINPDGIFFTFTDVNGVQIPYTYWRSRLIAASLARRLQLSGMRPGDLVSIDLPNCPELVFIILACAYGGFPVIMLDNHLSQGEKLSRLLEIERSGHLISCKFDATLTGRLLNTVRSAGATDAQIVKGICSNVAKRSRSIMGESQDALDDVIHFAERASHLFDKSMCAIVMFSGGRQRPDEKDLAKPNRSSKLKAIPLTWGNLLDTSEIANDALAAGAVKLWQERLPFSSANISDSERIRRSEPSAVWQCALPLTMIDGFQTLIRSVVARSPMRLYAGYDAEQILHDSEFGGVTHIAVNDDLLQDMLTVEEWRSDCMPNIVSRFTCYKCVLLTGARIQARTIERAYDLGARLFASFGLTETSGTIAIALITSDYRGGINPISNFDVCIVDPNEEGFGRLAVKGPGVFSGYMNTRTAFTVDQYFITDEKATIAEGRIFIGNRCENMFVSAGQNIYPAEIADVLRHVNGISGVHVFGVPDSRCGMLPVAAIERSDPALTPQAVEEMTHQWFSSITVPISIFMFDALPRTKRGKLDRLAIESIFLA